MSPKQRRFCEEYVIDLNATQAAIRAGYSKKTANEQAARLLAKVSVHNLIADLQLQIADRNKLKADDVIQELRALAFWSINDFVKEGNKLQDISQLDRTTNKPVMGIKTKTTTFEGGESTTVELKLADKRAALVDLGRHLGIFKEDNEQKTIKIKVSRK